MDIDTKILGERCAENLRTGTWNVKENMCPFAHIALVSTGHGL